MASVAPNHGNANFAGGCPKQKMIRKLLKICATKSFFSKMKAFRILCRDGYYFEQFIPEFICESV